MIGKIDTVDLGTAPPRKEAKRNVYLVALDELREIVLSGSAQELLRFHSKYVVALGHRRLGRMYLKIRLK